MKLSKQKTIFLAFMTVCCLQLTAQEFYINKLWEKESALLSGQQNHARTLLDQNDNILTVFNKKNNQSANIFSNRINSSGIETWQTEITNFLNVIGTENHGTDIKKDAQGNIYICGANYNGLNYDYLIVKYNTSGTEIWRRTYNGTGNSNDVPSSMTLDASGNVFVTGASYGLTSMTDFATLKINGQNGSIVWTSRYDFSNKYDGGTQVKLDNQGNVLVCGSSAQNLVNSDFVVIKYNPSNGNQLQIKRHNTPQNGYDIAIGMQIDASNNVYVVGTANSNLINKDIKIIAYNTNLQVNWVKYIDENGLEDDITGVVKDAYENILITGSTKNLQNEINILTAKISKVNGDIIWKQVEQNQNEITNAIGKGLGTDLNGNVVIVSEILKNNISFIQAISYDPNGLKRWEYINENIAMTNQKALDILVKGNDVILTGVKETTTGETLITVKLDPNEVTIVPDFAGEPSVASFGLETNHGQLLDDDLVVASNVKFYNERMNPAVFITENNIVLGFQQGQADSTIAVHRIDMDFVNSNPIKKIINLKNEEVGGIKNYYLRHKPDGFLNVKDYSRIIMGDVYENIDVQYYSGKNGMKYYINIKPSASPEKILLKFSGSDSITLSVDGSLDVYSAYGKITFNKPIAYQIDDNNQNVQLADQGYFIRVNENTVRFYAKEYQFDKPLFLQIEQKGENEDQTRTDNLKWSTFYGGANFDEFTDNTVDEYGNVYFSGSSTGLAFPRSTGNTNVFQSNLSSRRIVCGSHFSGGIRRWTTLYGAELDIAKGIITDNLGNVYITGVSSASGNTSLQHHFITFPKAGAYNLSPVNPAQPNNAYAFIIKFAQVNGTVSWSTLFGEYAQGAVYDAYAISSDESGGIYIAGYGKRVANAPILAQGAAYLDDENNVAKGFIAKFDGSTNALKWSTLFGNQGTIINGIEAYGHSSLLITGETSATNIANFPIVEEHVGTDYIDNTYNGGATDAFIARFDPGNALKWSTLFGGSGLDVSESISISNEGDIAIGGRTQSVAPSFPLLMIGNGYNINQLNGSQDAFLTVFRSTPTSYELKYSTYWGGNNWDFINKVKYTNNGQLYLVGTSNSQNLRNYMTVLDNAYRQDYLENDQNFGNHTNAFLFGLQTSDYRFKWGTFFGGKPHTSIIQGGTSDDGQSVAIHYNKLYICGTSKSQSNFPLRAGDVGAYFQGNNGCGFGSQSDDDNYYDGFIAEFDMTNTVLSTSLGIEELLESSENGNYLIYPNPSSETIVLFDRSSLIHELDNIEILDVSGKQVKKITNLQLINSSSISIEIADLPTGFYNVVLNKKSESINLKLIKN